MARIEPKDTKEEPKLAEEGSDDVQSTSDQESVVTVRRIYVVDVRISSPRDAQICCKWSYILSVEAFGCIAWP